MKDELRLADRERIRECLLNIPRGIFHRSAEIIKASYWPEAKEKHGVFDGLAYDFIEELVKRLGTREHTMIILGNIYFRFVDDRAFVESWGFSSLRNHTRAGEDLDSVAESQYFDELQCRNGEWRILARDAQLVWQAGLAAPITGAIPGPLNR